MEIVVCGAGQVGFNLVKYLADKGYSVTIIDNDLKLINYVDKHLDVKAVYGHASHPEVLKKANLDSADILIAVTNVDEVNMIICEVAHALFNVPKKIARVRSQSYLKMKGKGFFADNNLSIDYAISPEGEVAHSIASILDFPGVFKAIPFINNNLYLIGVRCRKEASIINTTIKYIPSVLREISISIVTIVRESEGIVPNSDTEILLNDEVYYIVKKDDIKKSLQFFGYYGEATRNLIIIGGGNIGLYLAEEVEAHYPNINLKIIEQSEERANLIAPKLSRTIVINGDGLDSDVLYEAGIEQSDTVISVTADDKSNVLSTVLAKKIGVNKVICLTNSNVLGNLVTSLGVDAAINPCFATVSKIMEYVSKDKLLGICSLGENLGEIIDIDATNTQNLIGTSIEKIYDQLNIIIAAIVREEEYIIPQNSDIVNINDRLIIMLPAQVAEKSYKSLGI